MMLQITDLENNHLFNLVSSQESATLLGGLTDGNWFNFQDEIGEFSRNITPFSAKDNKLFKVDVSKMAFNMVMAMPNTTRVFRWTN